MKFTVLNFVIYSILLLLCGFLFSNIFLTNSLNSTAIDYFEERLDNINNISVYYGTLDKFWINENTTLKYFIDNYYYYKPVSEYLLKRELNIMCKYHYD